MSHTTVPALYGLLAEFETPTDLVVAAKQAYAAGYRKMDAYSPYPIEEASEAIGFPEQDLVTSLIVLLGGILGGCSGYALQYVDQRDCLSAERGWPPLAFVAGVYRADLRDDGAVFAGLYGRVRHVCPQRTADALSSAVQRSAVFGGNARQVFLQCVEAADPQNSI